MRFRISQWQLILLLFTVSLGFVPFAFVDLYPLLTRHIWVAHLAQLGATLVGLSGVIMLLRRFPGQPIQTVAQRAAGPVLGWMYLLLLGVSLLWGPVSHVELLTRMTGSFQAPVAGSQLLVAVPVMLLAGYAAYFGVEVVARVTEVIAFGILPALVIISFVPFIHADPGRVLPLHGLQPSTWFDPEFWSFAIGQRGFVLLLALAGTVQDERRMAVPSYLAAIASAVSLFLIMVQPVVIFGPESLIHLQYPVLEAAVTVDATVLGIQSFGATALFIWFIIAVVGAASMLFAASHVLGSIFALPNHRKLLPWLTIGATVLAAFPLTPDEAAFLRHAWSLLCFVVGVAGPWILFASAALRGHKEVTVA